jgi:hypothetical protein
MSYDRSYQMTRLPVTTAARFERTAHPPQDRHPLANPSDPGPATDRSAWSWIIRHALCRYVSLDPGQWFPASTDPQRARHEAAAAIAICHGCPVRAQCLSISLQYWDIGQHGVWGGLVPAERATLRNGSSQGPPSAASIDAADRGKTHAIGGANHV